MRAKLRTIHPWMLGQRLGLSCWKLPKGTIVAFCGMLACLLAMLPISGMAQSSPEVRRFGDWDVLCANPGGTGAEKTSSTANASAAGCRAVQRLTMNGTDSTVFALTVLSGEKSGLVAIASIPTGGYLVPGIEVTVDGKKPYKLLIETCTASGCHAGFPLAGQVSKDLRTGKRASFRIWSSKSQSSDVKVSLTGFDDALTYLERRP